jgi:hypothetical protein
MTEATLLSTWSMGNRYLELEVPVTTQVRLDSMVPINAYIFPLWLGIRLVTTWNTPLYFVNVARVMQ